MQIKSLELENFRNYRSLSIEFSPKVNIIYGENGQGKTNILEGIYLCSTGKSHKGSRDRELIRIGCDEAHIKGSFSDNYGSERVDIHLKHSKGKGIALNRIPLKKISQLYGNIFIVIFSAEDLDIIRRGPAERRKFIDRELCQLDSIYVNNLINYNRIIDQRRELFKALDSKEEDRKALTETLDIWDLQLSSYGSDIIKRRRRFLEEIEETVFDIHYELTSGKEKIKLVYEPSCTEEDLYETLLKNRERDIYYRQTSAGPHRDDFSFFNGNEDLKLFGSNGQQRTCALSLKMAEIKMIEKEKKETPVLLLDDVLSELDRNRQRMLLKSLNNIQTIITCTGIDEFVETELKDAEKFCIKNAQILSQK